MIVTPEPPVIRFEPPFSVRLSAESPKLEGLIGSVKPTVTELTGVLRGPGITPLIEATAGVDAAITQLVEAVPAPGFPDGSSTAAALTVRV